jgi:NhaP-type Na+/H+ or K+/H+ antiporter/mannitol/fructose-specific phosphotransferase system IIA component (Ntr-type)
MHSNELLTTFTTAAAFGVCLFTLANFLRTTPIVILLIGGVIAGPEVLGFVHPKALGDGLGTIISLAVAIILFEGGMTLDLKGYRTASREILGILTIGVLVTWLGTAALLKLMFGFDIVFCLLSASLVIVTGPTVIGPLLHRIRATPKLQSILHWEGVLIDPIGVFISLLCFEFYVSTDGSHQLVLQDFLLRFAIGGMLGISFGFLLDIVLRRGWMDDGHNNVFVLAMAMLNFSLADVLRSESGLLSVTIMGLVLGIRKTPQLRAIVSYKSELKDFLIGLLFVLLAANLQLSSFLDYGWNLVLVVVGIMVLIRPLNVFLSTLGSSLDLKEKAFLSWIAPRGIVAASMASVFALSLEEAGNPNARFIETFAFSVIASTVIIQGCTAGILGRFLGVVRPIPSGWIIVGAHALGRQIAKFFHRHGVDVVLVDTNGREVRAAEQEGIVALNEDAMLLNVEEHPELYSCGNLLALTPNPDLNRMLCHRWMELLEGNQMWRWEKSGYETAENQHLLSGTRVWGDLPLNRWMFPGSELAPLHIQSQEITPPPIAKDILLTAQDKSVLTGTTPAIESSDREWLVFDRELSQQRLPLPLTVENILFSECNDLQQLYREMLEHLKKQLPAIDAEHLLEEIWKREEDYTSLLGNGIALPHSWSPDVEEANVVVARPQTHVTCPLTGRSIDIVFLLLSPVGHAEEHLEHLSFIARLIGSQVQRERIMHARNPEELFELIAMN